MKLMTLNTHSLEEKDYEKKLCLCAEGLLKLRPDILALQEVNQRMDAPEADGKLLEESGFVPCPEAVSCPECVPCSGIVPCSEFAPRSERKEGQAAQVPIRQDNHAFRLALLAARAGYPLCWTWVSAKVGYGRYDEGLALFSRQPIKAVRQLYLTKTREYENWKTRKALGIIVETEEGLQHVYSLHLGWWKDETEPFAAQWERLERETAEPRKKGETVWLMGDFNAPAGVPGESWEMVRQSGWLDTYEMAREKDEGITVGGVIDGWRDETQTDPAMRIDYIWCSRPYPIRRSMAVFNGKGSFGCLAYPPVSDHFGVLAETGRGETFSGTEGDRASAAGASIAGTKITCTNENKSE